MSIKGKKRQRRYLAEHCALCGCTLKSNDPNAVSGSTGGVVCKSCLKTAGKVSDVRVPERKHTALERGEILTPQKIISEMNKTIIGQEEAKTAVAISFWKQQLKANGVKDVPRSTLLIYGPTGCGKTAIAREAARIVGLPFISFDATTLSEAGYHGRDAADMVNDLIRSFEDHKQIEYGVIFLDEVDKLSAQGSEHRAAYARGTQHTLLKLVEGMEVRRDGKLFHTENMLFVFGGAFRGLGRKRTSMRTIGFCEMYPQEVDDERPVETEEFVSYGMEPELMGRITQRVAVKELSGEELRRVILDSDNSVLKQYQRFFRERGIDLRISPLRVERLVEEAVAAKSGARGLQTAMEFAVQPMLLRLAERQGYAEEIWEIGDEA